jgi:hypothetical protein
VKIALGVAALLLLAGPRPQDPATKAALKKFEEDFYRNGAKPEQKIQAVLALCVHKNEHTAKALNNLFSRDHGAVRIVAARELGRFGNVPQAGQVLYAALRNSANGGNKYAAVRVQLLRGLGELKVKDAAQEVDRMIEDKNVWIAKAAIDAAGKIKNKKSVDVLIDALKRIEGPMGDAHVALNPLIDAFKEITMGGLLGADGNERAANERELLKQPINTALGQITRMPYSSFKEWDAWWKSNKSTFEVRE